MQVGRCGSLFANNITSLLSESQQLLFYSNVQFVDGNSALYEDPNIYVNGTDYFPMLSVLPLEYEMIVEAQNMSSFQNRNKWADFGKRIALINLFVLANKQVLE